MPAVFFTKLWVNHPYPDSPCDTKTFENQCAIRMSEAFDKSDVDTSSFDDMFPGRRCWMGHSPGHILAAEEMAKWMESKSDVFGLVKKFAKGVSIEKFNDKRGIVFIYNGWGSMDHIDVWDGVSMKGGSSSYFSLGEEVWFWEL